MLRLSKMADYAGAITVHMAAQPQRVHTATSLSADLALSKATVAKCLKTLARHGVLVSQRGVNGGYKLARPASEISVAEIIVAMDGPVQMASCVDGHKGECPIERSCPLIGGWDSINSDIYAMLQRKSVADMVR